MREISNEMKDFLLNDGKSLFEKIKGDSTLDLEIRENRVEVYYHGVELFSIEEKTTGKFYFTKSGNSEFSKEEYSLLNKADIDKAIKGIADRKDRICDGNTLGYEREVQQLIVRENNYIKDHSRKTDYYIVDIEYAIDNLKFDMLAVKSMNDGKDRSTPPKKFAIIELKYDMDAVFTEKSGLKSHFEDLSNMIKDKEKLLNIKVEIKNLFNLKKELGLIYGDSVKEITKNDLSEKPEYIICLANFNAYKIKYNNKLINTLEQIKIKYPNIFEEFDVRFATSCFMGYGLFDECMWAYDDFINLL